MNSISAPYTYTIGSHHECFEWLGMTRNLSHIEITTIRPSRPFDQLPRRSWGVILDVI